MPTPQDPTCQVTNIRYEYEIAQNNGYTGMNSIFAYIIFSTARIAMKLWWLNFIIEFCFIANLTVLLALNTIIFTWNFQHLCSYMRMRWNL